MSTILQNDLFIKAATSQLTERPPVWMMRQAGRFMPEYWEIKNKYSFLEMCKTPEIAADVTMLPVNLLGIDAAILFCDILVTAEAMGGDLSFEQGVGPRFSNPVRNLKDAQKLAGAESVDKLQYVADVIKEIQQRLQGSIPLIGFAGAPFTILSYLVEGGSSRDFKLTKLMLNNEPELAHLILQKIADLTIAYLNMQIDAGVNAVQLFDSWAAALSWNDYKEFSHKYNKYIIANLKRTVPIISFAKGASVFAPLMVETKPDVISVDWNADLLNLKKTLPEGIAVQGNLDPFIMYANKPVIKAKILELFERMRGEKGFICNLGHGISPDMPFENVKFAIDTIKEFRY